MIRVKKSLSAPNSLQCSNPAKYNGQDVQVALYIDQNGKCYLCEQLTRQNYDIEHLKPKSKYPNLEFDWQNLLLICPNCNKKKSSGFENLINPISENIEEIIEHRIDYSTKNYPVVFQSEYDSLNVKETINLLNKLFNGVNKLRDCRTESLFKDLNSRLNTFTKLLLEYQFSRSDEKKQTIIDYLKIDKEYLAFKYWIIKDNSSLNNEFKEYMVWNKI